MVDQIPHYAHRASYQVFHGPIPPGAVVCHHCDNPPCWNPAHLFAGSQGDNIRDAVAKGRHVGGCVRGEKHYAAVLNEDDVRDIRASKGLSGTELARRYGVSPATIYKLLDGRSWKHVA